jgi:hypothetical protein
MFFERLKTFNEKITSKEKPDPILWSSASYFSNLAHLNPETTHQSLTWDIVTFLHEYVGLKDKKIYPYGERGIMNAYHIPTSQICKHHEQVLGQQGMEVTRAKLETKAAQTVEEWLANENTNIGEKLIIISPRGEESEGYPGLKPENYVFVNVYVKVGEDDFQLIQYTSYAREKELRGLQKQFIDQLTGEVYQPLLNKNDAQRYNQIGHKRISHHIIDTPITLSPHVEFTQIEEFIYQDEDAWMTTREDLPQVNEVAFNRQLETVLAMLLEQFWLLSEQSPSVAILHFDQLITIVREHFLKWVEEHATNYEQNETFAPYALNIEEILERWQLSIKNKQNQLTKKEENKLKLIKKSVELNPLQPLMRASSVAHCIVGTPGSLAMQAMRLNTGFLSITSPEFLSLSLEGKKGLLEKIKSENMTEITLENNETWMVPANFLEGKGCFINDEGVAMGPCDIPLIDSFAFMMNQADFNQFVFELEQQLLEEAVDQVQEELTDNLGVGSTQSKLLKEKLQQIKNIIFKPFISITELISGDLVSSSTGKSNVVKNIINSLKNSNNPIKTCEEILKKLTLEQNGVLAFGEV